MLSTPKHYEDLNISSLRKDSDDLDRLVFIYREFLLRRCVDEACDYKFKAKPLFSHEYKTPEYTSLLNDVANEHPRLKKLQDAIAKATSGELEHNIQKTEAVLSQYQSAPENKSFREKEPITRTITEEYIQKYGATPESKEKFIPFLNTNLKGFPKLYPDDPKAFFDYTAQSLRLEKPLLKDTIQLRASEIKALKAIANELYLGHDGDLTIPQLYSLQSTAQVMVVEGAPPKELKPSLDEAYFNLARDAATIRYANNPTPLQFTQDVEGVIGLDNELNKNNISIVATDYKDAQKKLASFFASANQASNVQRLSFPKVEDINNTVFIALNESTAPNATLNKPIIMRYTDNGFIPQTVTIIPEEWAKKHSAELLDWANSPEVQKRFNPENQIELKPNLTKHLVDIAKPAAVSHLPIIESEKMANYPTTHNISKTLMDAYKTMREAEMPQPLPQLTPIFKQPSPYVER